MTQDGIGGTSSPATRGMHVVTLAGRRIDAEGSTVMRFPLDHVDAVRDATRTALRETHAEVIVCSAACGADLLALEMAAELGLRAEIVLPFDVERFRATSVTDRPGDWGPLYDRLVSAAQERGGVTVLESSAGDQEAYELVTDLLLQKAQELSQQTADGGVAAEPGAVTAVVVWEGAPRGEDDLTAYFASHAQELGIPVRTILT